MFSDSELDALIAKHIPADLRSDFNPRAYAAEDALRRMLSETAMEGKARHHLRMKYGRAYENLRGTELLAVLVRKRLEERNFLTFGPSAPAMAAPRALPVCRGPEPIAEEKGYIWITVTDAVTKEPVPGVIMELFLPEAKKPQKATTDGNGEVRMYGVRNGTYRVATAVKEVKLNEVYAADWLAHLSGTSALAPIQPWDILGPGNPTYLADPRPYRVRTGDTLESIAEEFNWKWGTSLTSEVLAYFNWGRTDAAGIAEGMRKTVGCTQKAEDGKDYAFDDSDEPGILFIPRPLEKLHGTLGQMTIGVRPMKLQVERLESTFAFEQTQGLTRLMDEESFVVWVAESFGWDVPLAAYRRLWRELKDGSLPQPEYRVVSAGLDGHLAGHERKGNIIKVHQQLLRSAEKNNADAAKLLVALVEEFGHYLDYLLRHVYDTNLNDNAPGDEGAIFAYALVNFRLDQQKEMNFASYFREGETVALRLRYPELHEAAQRYLSKAEREDDGRSGTLAYFGPTEVDPYKPGESFAHKTIENVLRDSFESEEDLRCIYFGNWLRDNSQLVAAVLMRRPGEAGVSPQFARQHLTELVAKKAREEFGPLETFKVDEKRLGVYRSEEHLDNPKGIGDERDKDADFEPPYVPLMGEVDPKGLKNYLWNGVGYIGRNLGAAVDAGFTDDGMRLFGTALHPLEDFFSHSNFIELALISLGYPEVQAWTAPVQGSAYRFPLVTGVFGGLDTVASLLYHGREADAHRPVRPEA